jgi:hypothetical protein
MCFAQRQPGMGHRLCLSSCPALGNNPLSHPLRHGHTRSAPQFVLARRVVDQWVSSGRDTAGRCLAPEFAALAYIGATLVARKSLICRQNHQAPSSSRSTVAPGAPTSAPYATRSAPEFLLALNVANQPLPLGRATHSLVIATDFSRLPYRCGTRWQRKSLISGQIDQVDRLGRATVGPGATTSAPYDTPS